MRSQEWRSMGRMMQTDLPTLPALVWKLSPHEGMGGGGVEVMTDILDYLLALLCTLQISWQIDRGWLGRHCIIVWSLGLTYNPYFDKKERNFWSCFFCKGPNQVGVLTLTLQTNLEAQSIFAFILSFDILRELEYLQWVVWKNKNSFYSYIIYPDFVASAGVSAFSQ